MPRESQRRKPEVRVSWNGFSPNIIWHFSTSFLQLTDSDLSTLSGYPKQPMKMPPSKDYLYAPKSFPLMSFQWRQCPLVRLSIVYISLIFSCTFHWSSRCRSPLSIEQASNWNGFYKCTGEGSWLFMDHRTFMVMHNGPGTFPPTRLCHPSEHGIYIPGRKQYFLKR